MPSDFTPNVRLVCRIRSPKNPDPKSSLKSSKNSNSGYVSVRNRSAEKGTPGRKSTSRDRSSSRSLLQSAPLHPEKKYCVFTSKEPSNTVVASDTPV